MNIRVLICDDDPIVREALSGYLRDTADIRVVATAGTAEEAVTLLPEHTPDVVLMDLAMPGSGGLAGAREIRRSSPGTTVIMLTTFGTDEQVREALATGAAGFLLKSASAASLRAAVHAAHGGAGVIITPEVAAALARDETPAVQAPAAPVPDAPAPSDSTASALTERELDVLHLLCRADTNTQIARQLRLSESTVKKHVSSLMAKLDCTSRLQIAVRAFELGLAEPPGPHS